MLKGKCKAPIPEQKDIIVIANHLLSKGYCIKLNNRLQSLIRIFQVQKELIYHKYWHLLAEGNQSTATDEEQDCDESQAQRSLQQLCQIKNYYRYQDINQTIVNYIQEQQNIEQYFDSDDSDNFPKIYWKKRRLKKTFIITESKNQQQETPIGNLNKDKAKKTKIVNNQQKKTQNKVELNLEIKLKIFDQISKLSEKELDSIFQNIDQSSFSFEEWPDEVWHNIIQKLSEIGVSVGVKKQIRKIKLKGSTKEPNEIYQDELEENPF